MHEYPHNTHVSESATLTTQKSLIEYELNQS